MPTPTTTATPRPPQGSRSGPLLRGAQALGAAVLAIASAACSLIPAYTRPELPVPEAWPDDSLLAGRNVVVPEFQPAPLAPDGVAAADIGWRDFFVDPAIQRLIEIALVNNRDARVAAINVAAAQQQYRIQRADLFPTIDASLQAEYQRIPGAIAAAQSGGTATAGGAAAAIPGSVYTRTYTAGIGFTAYELDVFGRVRSLSTERLEQYFGYIETQKSSIISLVAQVANGWLQILADRELLRVTEETLQSQRESYALTKRGVDGGVQTLLTLRQAETSVETAAANLAQYTRQLAQDRNALMLLLGAPLPADLAAAASFEQARFVEDLPSGVPSELLARRPDVLSAEHNLIAANASIGAARAAFFPSISLTGSYGHTSTALHDLFHADSRAWTFSPTISVPIFAGGANVANLRLAEEQKRLYVAQYEKAIQTAFREVSDALVARSTLVDQQEAQARLQDAAADYYRLSKMRFDTGIATYLDVLDAQRTLYTAQQTLVGLKLQRLQNLVTLYKVLGGGWNERTGAAAAAIGASGAAFGAASDATAAGLGTGRVAAARAAAPAR